MARAALRGIQEQACSECGGHSILASKKTELSMIGGIFAGGLIGAFIGIVVRRLFPDPQFMHIVMIPAVLFAIGGVVVSRV